MNYDVDYFIDKLSKKDNWCTGNVEDVDGNHCVLGHCGVTANCGTWVATEEALAFCKLLASFENKDLSNLSENDLLELAWRLNDRGTTKGQDNWRYRFHKPKEVILKRLTEIKEWQNKEQPSYST